MKQTQTPSCTDSLNYQWAFSLIHYFTIQGVTQAVISPGSRSTPLALACEQHPDISIWVQIDERSAAFFALGLAQEKHQPVILICTSGSAVANWFPAVVEASYSYTPLLLLSADRPTELHNCGANQTIQQDFLFGSHVRDFIALEHANKALLNCDYLASIATQAYAQSLQQKPGPVHINIPFREPLLPKCSNAVELNEYIHYLGEQSIVKAATISRESLPPATLSSNDLKTLEQTLQTGNGLIICGRLNRQEQRNFINLLPQLADKLNCPVLIDPLSNLRFCSAVRKHAIYNYDHFLKQTQTDAESSKLVPQWIIRFGQFPVSKTLLQYLQSLTSDTILVSSYGDQLDPLYKATSIVYTSPETFCRQLLTTEIKSGPDNWVHHWQQNEENSEVQIKQVLQASTHNDTAFFEGHIISSLLNYIPDQSLLFSANSMVIRDFDTFITHDSAQNKQIDFYANRGTSGIDGNISAFFGLLASHNGYGVAVLGDLSFYHDMNGLLISQQLAALGKQATIIVINNNGGGIFNYLPQQQLNSFDKLWKTEINLDFQHTARLYGLTYYRVETSKELAVIMPEIFKQPGIQLLEIIIDQQISVECHKKI